MSRLAVAMWVLTCQSAAAWAQGGPPLLTDDPDTPGPRHWEINIAALIDASRLEHRVELPLVDLNYGVGRRIQLKLEAPWLRVREGHDAIQTGAGDAVAGVKWRFLGEEGRKIAWSIYPQFEFNTVRSSIAKGIVEKGRQLLLPTELTVEFAHVEINGEVGRILVEDRPASSIFGVSSEIIVTKRLELLGELHGEQVAGAATELFTTIGARPKLSPQLTLLVAAGRTVHNTPNAGRRGYAYIGLQLHLPDQYAFNHGAAAARP